MSKLVETTTRESRRGDIERIVNNLTPVDLLWLRTTVEQELNRRGFGGENRK
jgi:hypothetical protein